jgi:hypothetical protein
LDAAEKFARTIARRPVPTVLTGVRRLRVYCPAEL